MPVQRPSPRTSALVVLLCATACFTTDASRRRRSPVELFESARPLFSLAPDTYAASVPLDVPGPPDVAAFLEACGPERASRLVHDPAFDLLGHLYGLHLHPGEWPGPAAFQAWLAWRLGAVTSPKHIVSVVVEPDQVHARMREVFEAQCARLDGERRTFGVAEGTGTDGSGRLVLVHAPRFLDLAPVPRRLPPGATLTLSGRLSVPDRGLLLYVERDGRPGVLPVPATEDGTFTVDVPLPAKLGRAFLEFVLDGSVAPHASLLLVPVDLGEGGAAALDPWIQVPEEDPPGEASRAAAILSTLDAVRPAAGLASLESSDVLARFGARQLEETRGNGGVVPVRTVDAPGLGVTGDRVVVLSGLVERIDRDVRAFLWSPWVRHALLDPALTHAGVHVVRESDGRLRWVAVLANVLPAALR